MDKKTEIFNLLREIFRETRQFEEALRQSDLEDARTHIENRGALYERLNSERGGIHEPLSRQGPDEDFDLLEGLGELVRQVREIEKRCQEEMEKSMERITEDLGVACRRGYIHKWLDHQIRVDRSSFVDVRDEDIP